MRKPLPRNPNFCFLFGFASAFTCLLCLASFAWFYASKVFVSHVCLIFCYHMLELRIILCLLFFNAMIMHSYAYE